MATMTTRVELPMTGNCEVAPRKPVCVKLVAQISWVSLQKSLSGNGLRHQKLGGSLLPLASTQQGNPCNQRLLLVAFHRVVYYVICNKTQCSSNSSWIWNHCLIMIQSLRPTPVGKNKLGLGLGP